MTRGATPAQPNVEAGCGNSPVVVSVVLPTFNGSRYLAESIQSVIVQTFQDWELIIVDDCSTDDTPQIIERFVQQDPRIRGIRHETNRKLPAALNTGFADARGEFFTWTSDDNVFKPQALEEMLDFLQTHDEATAVYCDYTEIDESGAPAGKVRVDAPEALAFRNCVGACFLYRASAAKILGEYDVSSFGAEDYDWWLRMARRFRLACLHRDLYRYRVHSASLSAKIRVSVLRNRALALHRHLPHLQGLSRQSRAAAAITLARDLADVDEKRRARLSLLRALRAGWRPRGSTERNEALGLLVGQKASLRFLASARRLKGWCTRA